MKATRELILTMVLLLVGGGVIACSRAPSDEQIARSVQTNIDSDASISTKAIRVDYGNGVVTLSGNVGSDAEKIAAANDAWRVDGVKTVVNNLQVAPAAAASAGVRPGMVTRSAAAPRATAGSYGSPAAAPANPGTVTLPEGTQLSVRMIDSVDTERNKQGDSFHASLAAPLMVGGRVVVPKNADVEGHIVALQSAGRMAGRSEVALALTSVTVDGKQYSLETEQYVQQGSSRGKRTAEVVGGTAAAGAVIGGIVGGGKGAAIGAAAGAGAGTGVEAATKGQQIRIPSETIVDFRLSAPLTLVPSSSAGRGRVG